jgi:hypothetical protein
MSSTDRIDYTVKDRIAVIAMNRPPVNAIDHPMIDAIHAVLPLQLSFALFAALVGRCRVRGAKPRADLKQSYIVPQLDAKNRRNSVPFVRIAGVCCTCVPGLLPLLRCRSVSPCFR